MSACCRLHDGVGAPEVPGGSGAGRLAAGVVTPSEPEDSLPFPRGRLWSFPGRRWWHAPGPGDGGMTLGKRHESRFGRAARSGLRSVLGGKGFPQLSQEDWVTLHR